MRREEHLWDLPWDLIATDGTGDEGVEGHCGWIMLMLMMDAPIFLICAAADINEVIKLIDSFGHIWAFSRSN